MTSSEKRSTDEFLRLEVRINAATHPELYSTLNALNKNHRTKRLVTLALIGHSRTADIMSAQHEVTTVPRTSIPVLPSDIPPAIQEKVSDQVSGNALSTSISEASKTYSVSESAADDIGNFFLRTAATE